MQLDHEFTVPVPAEEAWDVLLDVERIAPCMPGATVEAVEDDSFTGNVKVRVGPITVAYSGRASFLEKDAAARRVVVEAKGRETRGAGTAAATVTAQLHEQGEDTRVTVRTDLAITGRPAQFGRGVMDDVGRKLLDQFSACVADRLSAREGAAAGADTGGETGGETGAGRPSEPSESRPTTDTINLVEVAGGSVARRLAPAAAVAAVLAIIWLIIRSIRS